MYLYSFYGFIGLLILRWMWKAWRRHVWRVPTRDELTNAPEEFTGGEGQPRHFKERLVSFNEDELIVSPPSLQLTVVVPAMNEEARLPAMLDETFGYLEKRRIFDPQFTYEVLLVDDGSTDGTSEVALECARRRNGALRVLRRPINAGKGAAVRAGVMSSKGRHILICDADGSTPFEQIEKLEAGLREVVAQTGTEEAVVIGSRNVAQPRQPTKNPFRLLAWLLYYIYLGVTRFAHIGDTQCGFKLLTRWTAARCFSVLHFDRWAFDIELLYLALRLRIPIKEISVDWMDVAGSKCRSGDAPRFYRDVAVVSIRYGLGIWKDTPSKR